MIEAKRALEEAIRLGKPIPEARPTSLPLRRIQRLPGLFQVRMPHKKDSKDHVRELLRPLHNGRPLEPVLVIWGGGGRYGWVCVDGHHRLAAYVQAKWKEPVPVRVFEGTVTAGLHEASRANTAIKLNMRTAELAEVAWKLVKLGASSKAEIVESANVSDGLVGKMRRAHRSLLDAGYPLPHIEAMRWSEARALAVGGDIREEVGGEEWLNKKVHQAGAQFMKTYGKMTPSRADIVAEALMIYAPSVVGILREGYVPLAEEDA